MDNDQSQRYPGRPTRAKHHDELELKLEPEEVERAYHRVVSCEECGAACHAVFVPNRKDRVTVHDEHGGQTLAYAFECGQVHVVCTCGHAWSDELGNYDDYDRQYNMGIENMLDYIHRK